MKAPENYQHDIVRGFHVATCEMPHMESVSVGIFIPVGSRFEHAAINGIAHFAEHIIFKGTGNRTALNLSVDIEGSGGTINAFTSEDQTCLETRGPAELLPLFLEVMSDMLWNSSFPPEEVEREREVISEEIVMYQENPGDHLHDLLSLALWPDHSLGRQICGTEASILGINADSLREFTEKHYTTEGLTIAVSGKITHEQVLRLVDKFLPEKATKASPFDKFTQSPFNGVTPLMHDQREIEQSHIALAFHTSGRHSEDRQVLRMLSLLLGETMSSRLFQEMREKRGLCYHISSDFSLYEDTGTFEIHAGLDGARLEESIIAINTLLNEVLTTGFTDAELAQAKRFAMGQARIGLESPQAQMSWMGDSLTTYGKIVDPIASRNMLDCVTLVQIKNLAEKTFKLENLVIASIGPHTKEQIREVFTKLVLP